MKLYRQLNKWTQDENSAWRDMVFHAKNFKMEKIVEREFSKNAFGILITNLENILKLDEQNLFKKADSPLATVQFEFTVKPYWSQSFTCKTFYKIWTILNRLYILW